MVVSLRMFASMTVGMTSWVAVSRVGGPESNTIAAMPSSWCRRAVSLRTGWAHAWTLLPQLERLVCPGIGLGSLDLSLVPGLTVLRCQDNQLTALDLAPVPGLAPLSCDPDVRVLNAPPGLKIHRHR